MKFPLLNIDGSKSDSIEISDKLVKLKVNHKLIKFVIDWQLNHAKPRIAKTKQRNQIKGSTKKIVPQKGGGGARHASKKAPLFVGGGGWSTYNPDEILALVPELDLLVIGEGEETFAGGC